MRVCAWEGESVSSKRVGGGADCSQAVCETGSVKCACLAEPCIWSLQSVLPSFHMKTFSYVSLIIFTMSILSVCGLQRLSAIRRGSLYVWVKFGASYWSQASIWCLTPIVKQLLESRWNRASLSVVPATEVSDSPNVSSWRGHSSLVLGRVLQTLSPRCKLLGWPVWMNWVPAPGVRARVWVPLTCGARYWSLWGSFTISYWSKNDKCSQKQLSAETNVNVSMICVCIWLERIKYQLLGGQSELNLVAATGFRLGLWVPWPTVSVTGTSRVPVHLLEWIGSSTHRHWGRSSVCSQTNHWVRWEPGSALAAKMGLCITASVRGAGFWGLNAQTTWYREVVYVHSPADFKLTQSAGPQVWAEV